MFEDMRYIENVDVSNNLITEVESKSFSSLYKANVNMSYNRFCFCMNSSKNVPFYVAVLKTYRQMCSSSVTTYPWTSATMGRIGPHSVNNKPNLCRLRWMHPDAFDSLSYAFSLNVSHNMLTNMSQVTDIAANGGF